MPQINFNILNQLQSPAFYASSLASRPTFGFLGRIFIDTDIPSTGLYRDTGTAWVSIADPGAGSTGTLEQVTTNGNTSTKGLSITSNGIGIGTVIPSTNRIDIHSSSGLQGTFNGTTTTNSGLQLQNAGLGKWTIRNNYNAGANDFGIFDFTNSIDRFKITSAGVLSITGITNLSSRLNINGAIDNALYALNVTGAVQISTSLTTGSNAVIGGDINLTGNINQLGLNVTPGTTATNQTFLQWRNTGGDLYIGKESSTAGGFFTASSAYANVFYSSQNFQFIHTNVKRFEVTTTGGTLTGIGSVSQRLNIGSAGDNALFSLNNGGGTFYTNGFSPNATNYTGAQTLGGGTTYVNLTAGVVTWTLPTPSGNNQMYFIKNAGTGILTLNAFSALQIIDLTNTAVSSVAIAVGQTLIIQQDGNNKSYIIK
jgi:hypothetical protein